MTPNNTIAWRFQVWASFLIASSATAVGILYLPLDPWTKGYLAMGLLFTVGSCFSLAKTLRDDHEVKQRTERHDHAHPFRSAT